MTDIDSKAQNTGNSMLRTFANVGKNAVKMGAMIGAAGAAAGAALFALTSRISGVGDEIDKTSAKVGLSTTAFQELRFAADIVGVEAGSLDRALATLNTRMGDATGEGDRYKAHLERLGITADNTDDAFMQIIDTLHNMEDSNLRAAHASEIFGERLARELMPAIREGGEEIERLRNRAHDLGKVMDEDAIAASVRFKDTMTEVRAAFSGVVQQIGLRVMPMFQTFLDWVLTHIPKISAVFEFIGEVVEIVTRYMRLIFADAISFIQNRIIEPFAAWAMNFWEEYGEDIGNALTDIWDALKAIFQVGIDAFKGIFNAFMLAFQGDWEGAWDELKDTFKMAWDAMPELFENAWDAMVSLFDTLVNVFLDLIESVFGEEVRDSFESIWDGVLDIFDVFKAAFLGLWKVFDAAFRGDWEQAWNELKETARAIWEAIPGIFENIFDGLTGIMSTIANAVINVIEMVFGPNVADAFRDIWNAVEIIFDTFKETFLGLWRVFDALFRGEWEEAWEELKETARNIWEAIPDIFESLFSGLTSIMSTIANAVIDIIENIFGPDVADSFRSIWSGIEAAFELFKDTFLGIWRVLDSVFRGEWEEAWEEIKNVASNIWNTLPEIFEDAFDGLVGVIDNIIQPMLDLIRLLFGDDVGDIFQNAWDSTLDVFEIFKDTFLSVWRAFDALFKGEWEEAWVEVKNIVTNIFDIIETIIDTAFDTIIDLADIAMTAIINVIRDIFGDKVGDVVQAGWDTVKIVFETIKDVLLGALDVFRNAFEGDWRGAWGSIIEIFETIWSGIRSVFMGPLLSVTLFAKTMLGNIKNFFVDLKDSAIKSVSEMVNSITEWFGETKLGKAMNTAKGYVDSVTGWFFDMYDKVVGNSYVPDMVEEIGEAMERLRDKLANPVQRYTAIVLDSFDELNDKAVQTANAIANAFADIGNIVQNTLVKVADNILRGTVGWEQIMVDFLSAVINQLLVAAAGAIGIAELVSLAMANMWNPLGWIAIAGLIAALATIRNNLAKNLNISGEAPSGSAPDTDIGGGDSGGPTAGRQVSEITGPTRDIFLDIAAGLAPINTIVGILNRTYDLLDMRLPQMQVAGTSNITIEEFNIYPATSGVDDITDATIDQIEQSLAERIEDSGRGLGR